MLIINGSEEFILQSAEYNVKGNVFQCQSNSPRFASNHWQRNEQVI